MDCREKIPTANLLLIRKTNQQSLKAGGGEKPQKAKRLEKKERKKIKLQKISQPGYQRGSMFLLDPMLQQGHILSKTSLPPPISRPLIIEFFCITNQSNVPASRDQHLHEKRITKTPLCLGYDRLRNHISIAIPTDLQIIPNS
jgi:hypothetical protein